MKLKELKLIFDLLHNQSLQRFSKPLRFQTLTAKETMTTKLQKDIEIIYARSAGALLDEFWEIEPAPDEVSWPDLLVTTEFGKFGLEVRELYQDESSKGSKAKVTERHNIKIINNLSTAYYNRTSSSIKVDFLGNIGCHDLILNTLINVGERLPEFEQKRFEPYSGCTIYIRRLPDKFGKYTRWNYVSDKVGIVRKINQSTIEKAIFEKAKNLTKYKTKIADVRLLIVSNRIFNSGKARIEKHLTCNACGFSKVYYLSYPEEIWQVSS